MASYPSLTNTNSGASGTNVVEQTPSIASDNSQHSQSPSQPPGRVVSKSITIPPHTAVFSPNDSRRPSVCSNNSKERRHESGMSNTTGTPSEVQIPNLSQRRPSVHSNASTHSNPSYETRKKSLTSMDLAALENMQRSAKQISVKDLADPEAPVDASPAGIQKVLQDERARLSNKISSQAYENNMSSVRTEGQVLSPTKTYRKDNIESNQKVTPPDDPDAEIAAAEAEKLAMYEKLLKYVGLVSPMKWFMTVVIAVLIALQAGAFIFGTIRIVEVKRDLSAQLAAEGSTGQFYAFLVLLAYGSPACFIGSWLVTYVAPHAGGSGIPEIKAFLNGMQMPKAFTFATWASRSIGLMLVTSAGMFAGTEGPFAHLGGITAKFFADGPKFLGPNQWPTILKGHRNRCEFVSQGAAMGVAAAFGAPIGGILFSLEEASSFWSKNLTWRAFLGTVIAALVAKLAKSGFSSLNVEGFISFPDKDASFALWELLTFGALAVVSGLLGALFCNSVKRVLLFRRRLFSLGAPTKASKIRRMVEVQVIVVFTLVVCFWPAAMIGCREMNVADTGARRLGSGSSEDGPPSLFSGLCPRVDGRETYSDLGYILLSPKEKAIKTLFSREMADGAYLSATNLLLAWFITFFTTILTFGTAMPVGLFIPNIQAGACLGRAFGQLLMNMDFDVHPGVYALMGAAGALGGFSRMTISLAVIFLEITNNMNLLMPLMLVIMLSKNVGDLFGPSVYDVVLNINPDVHLLEDDLSEDHLIVLQGLKVHDVCCRDIVVLRTEESIAEIVLLLQRCKYSGFPIVTDTGVSAGLITRTQLVKLLDEHSDGSKTVNLLVHADTSPDITLWNTSVVHAFKHFRSCGLQHLYVVDNHFHLVGILTRTDFAKLCHHGLPIEEVRALIAKNHEAAGDQEQAAR